MYRTAYFGVRLCLADNLQFVDELTDEQRQYWVEQDLPDPLPRLSIEEQRRRFIAHETARLSSMRGKDFYDMFALGVWTGSIN